MSGVGLTFFEERCLIFDGTKPIFCQEESNYSDGVVGVKRFFIMGRSP